jgi:type I restriction enzyme S subunit
MKALISKETCLPEYLTHLLAGLDGLMLAHVEDSAHGTKCLRTDRWKGIEVWLPQADEQRRIATWIDDAASRFGNTIAKTREQIGKLQEYRVALISAAVTGQIDVGRPGTAGRAARSVNVSR